MEYHRKCGPMIQTTEAAAGASDAGVTTASCPKCATIMVLAAIAAITTRLLQTHVSFCHLQSN